jgi:hypothetical protein
MRTGAEYREALRDGRRVWVIGEGLVEDVTVHPATRGTVDEYVAWYDRHFDREWQDILLTPPDAAGARAPLSYIIPKSPDDLRAMGRCFSATTFLSAGNITHTPAYGNLIALGILDAVRQRNVSPEQIANAAGYRELIARTGRFLTFSAGAATIGYRMRQDPGERVALKLVRETDAGLGRQRQGRDAYEPGVRRGRLRGQPLRHRARRASRDLHRARRRARRDGPLPEDRRAALESVLGSAVEPVRRAGRADVARQRIHSLGPHLPDGRDPEPMASWLFWHQLYCWLSKAEFTLGLALACTHAMGLVEHEPTIEYLIDLVVDVQTVRSCQTAAELDPEFTPEGYCIPRARPHRGGQHRHAEGPPAHGRDPENSPGLLARSRALGQGPRGAGGRSRARGIVRGRRLHGAAALGLAAARERPRHLGAGRS